MYWKPKDGYPDLNTYQGFSVGDLVRLPWNSSFGEIVRICQMPHWDQPTIIIEWLTNGRIGHHTIERLELIMTHEQWIEDIRKQREEERERQERYAAQRKAQRSVSKKIHPSCGT